MLNKQQESLRKLSRLDQDPKRLKILREHLGKVDRSKDLGKTRQYIAPNSALIAKGGSILFKPKETVLEYLQNTDRDIINLTKGDKYFNRKAVTLCFMGDGAVRQGSFHETLNLAMLWKLPVVFIVENNGYAMGTSVERTSNHTDIWKLGLGYEMPCGPVDGMNPIKVAEALDEAIKRARNEEGPTLLEMKTYRYRGHSMSDAQQYRTKEEVNEYRKIDPISQIKKVILENDFATDQEISNIDRIVKSKVLECEKFAEDSPYPEKKVMYDAVYEEENYNFISHKLT